MQNLSHGTLTSFLLDQNLLPLIQVVSSVSGKLVGALKIILQSGLTYHATWIESLGGRLKGFK